MYIFCMILLLFKCFPPWFMSAYTLKSISNPCHPISFHAGYAHIRTNTHTYIYGSRTPILSSYGLVDAQSTAHTSFELLTQTMRDIVTSKGSELSRGGSATVDPTECSRCQQVFPIRKDSRFSGTRYIVVEIPEMLFSP